MQARLFWTGTKQRGTVSRGKGSTCLTLIWPSLMGVAVMTETAETAKTAIVASLCCILQEKPPEGKVTSRTAKTVKT